MKDDLDSINNLKTANDILNHGSGRIALGLRPQATPTQSTQKPTRILPALFAFIFALSIYVFVFNSSPFSSKVLKPQAALASSGGALLVTSGHFISERQARNYKSELQDRIGMDLHLLKIGNSYTIQIGPSYSSHEDALLVFDELSRYAVADLSLRFE